MAEKVRRVRPTPTDAYLANPHKGCCTFQHFNGDPLFPGTGWSESGPTEFPPAQADVVEGYLPTTVAYCRWFWELMEPEKGRYDFSMIDGALEACRQRGQTLAVRLMAYGSARQPRVPKWYSDRYPMEINRTKRVEFPAPVHDAPEYLEHWGGFIREFARRYGAHPLLETIDVTYIGPWGEGAGECSVEQCRRFARLWQEAFVHTRSPSGDVSPLGASPRLALIAGDQMREGIATGAGWRCDCFGDLKDPGSPHVPKHLSWNHMYDCYPEAVVKAGAQEAWKTAPVHFETCWVPMHWYRQGFDIDFILQQGLKYHGTYFMPKYTRLPEPWMDKLAAFCRKLGYRFVLRQAAFDSAVEKGGAFRFQCWIENVGVAPIYRRYDFALRLRQGQREAVLPLKHVDIRTWLPGDVWLDEQIAVPAYLPEAGRPEGFSPGWAELSAGLIDPITREAKVSFAVQQRYSDRWAPLAGIEIR